MMRQTNHTVANTAVSEHTLLQIQNSVKDALEQVMGDSSPEMLDEMASIFLEDAVPLITQMREGLANRDFTSISMAAHALKGSSATIGLLPFSELCLAVEASSKQGQAELTRSNLASLEADYPTVQQALQAFLF